MHWTCRSSQEGLFAGRSYGDACRYQHDDITGWTEAKKSATGANLAYRFRQPSLDALGKVKSGKTRV